MGDLHSITTADGQSLYFPQDKQVFTAYGGYGAPPIDYQTRQGYKQDGVTEVNYQLAQRTISINLYRAGFCEREEYHQYRALLHDMLRPNRNGQATLTLRQVGGTKRAIKVRPNPGAVFAPISPNQNNWDINEPLEFIAFDPLWFDPDQVISSGAITISSHLVFPFVIHANGNSDDDIQFGFSGSRFTSSITYAGTWKTYPRMEIAGPYLQATIEHVELGLNIGFTSSIAAGEQRIIDLQPGAFTVTDASGNNKFGELSPTSDLVDFLIMPSPELAGGVNTIRVTLTGASGASAFTVKYYTKYFGI